MRILKVGASVRIDTMASIAIGRIRRVTETGYEVRLPNWQADGVHLDVYVRRDEVSTGHGRAETCRCCFCR